MLSVINIELIALLSVLVSLLDVAIAVDDAVAVDGLQRGTGVIQLPLYQGPRSQFNRRAGGSSAIGIGDTRDISYTVNVNIGTVNTLAVVIDTGSSDIWVASSDCEICIEILGNTTITLYPANEINGTEDITLAYGDSSTATEVSGLVAQANFSLAGLSLPGQVFLAANSTNSSALDSKAAGILGLGHVASSLLWRSQYQQNPSAGLFRRSTLSSLDTPNKFSARQSQPDILSSFSIYGPFLTRLILSSPPSSSPSPSPLPSPQFTITLERTTIQPGGNTGQLTLGGLPPDVSNDTLTWVNVRRYSPLNESGLQGAPGEEYPYSWEVFLDDVYLNGVKLPRSTLGDSANVALSALIDTGNSLIRGPQDVIYTIYTLLNTSSTPPNSSAPSMIEYPCSSPPNLTFIFNNRPFTISALDFGTQKYLNDVDTCVPNLAVTDPPEQGSFLYSWSLGAPFLKGVLASFYYGNITYPSTDPPRIGLLSTVTNDSISQLQDAIASAKADGNNFPALTISAPTGAFSIAGTDSLGVGQAAMTASGGGSTSTSRSGAVSISSNLENNWIMLFSLIFIMCIRYIV